MIYIETQCRHLVQRLVKVLVFLLPFIAMSGCQTDDVEFEKNLQDDSNNSTEEITSTVTPEKTRIYGYSVVNSYPHDPRAFTQGLVYVEGDQLLEGTGLRGQSTLRRVELATGKVTQTVELSDSLFGEGITVFNGKVYQLTWQARKGFVYDLKTFTQLNEFSYPMEGWGLTNDNTYLIISDGTSTIRFWDPENFKESKRIQVHDQSGKSIQRINELEYVNGEIYANIWQTNRIARIDPSTGLVLGWFNLTGLLSKAEQRNADVLNGIAYDLQNNRLFVTGKLWPKLFQIRLNSEAKEN